MYIEDLKEEGVGGGVEETSCREIDAVFDEGEGSFVSVDVKRVFVGAGARVLFYPTLLYNVVRNKVQTDFRWWDRVTEFVLLGAVPFPTDVPCLKELGVRGVITLNEPYETLVPTTLYQAHGIEHLVIATRDYCFAPSLNDICQAVEFLHKNASCGQTTYVHCKAGRGRSTTIVICYLVKHTEMTPESAYAYVKSIRPRVLLASAQWLAVQQYYYLEVKKSGGFLYNPHPIIKLVAGKTPNLTIRTSKGEEDHASFEGDSVVLVTKSDLVGYNNLSGIGDSGRLRSEIWAVYRVRVAGQAALARISCFWVRYREQQHKVAAEGGGLTTESSNNSNCGGDHVGGSISVDIHVY